MHVYTCGHETPLGMATAATDGRSLTGFWFNGQKYFPEFSPEVREDGDHAVFSVLRRFLTEYFSGKNPADKPAFAPEGTVFQKAVWNLLLEIPCGQTITYGELCKRLNLRPGAGKTSPRAVGSAVGRNPISVLIPCHRVVGAGGKLTGYAGGLDRKAALLKLENNLPAK